MKEEVLLKGKVRNGLFLFDKPKLAKSCIDSLENGRFQMLLSAEQTYRSSSSLGYYFGGIIRNTCMRSNLFESWTFNEIDQFFRKNFLTYKKELVRYISIKDHKKRKKIVVSVPVTEPLESLSQQHMNTFINHVIAFLSIEGIEVLSPEDYKLKRYSEIREKRTKKP